MKQQLLGLRSHRTRLWFVVEPPKSHSSTDMFGMFETTRQFCLEGNHIFLDCEAIKTMTNATRMLCQSLSKQAFKHVGIALVHLPVHHNLHKNHISITTKTQCFAHPIFVSKHSWWGEFVRRQLPVTIMARIRLSDCLHTVVEKMKIMNIGINQCRISVHKSTNSLIMYESG